MDGTSVTSKTPDRQTPDGKSPDRRTRVAAHREAARRARARNRVLIAGGAIVAVIAVVVAFVVMQGSSSPSRGTGPAAPAGAALSAVVGKVTSVPPATSDAAGTAQASKPGAIAGPPLTAHGKPEMLYIGAEYCPYCAAQRWAMVVALSRFGTFKGLAPTHSAAQDGAGHAEPYPNTPTWTFAKATYHSKYLAFSPVELNTNIPDPGTGGYTNLDKPTAAQQALLDKYDAAYKGAIPFVDLGNKYVTVGASFDPSVLSGRTWSQLAGDLHNPASPVAKSVLGAANYLSAAICGLTNNQPASACTPAIRALRDKL